MRLTIVVPVYNAASFLRRCLDSILRQGLSDEDYEVLLVNDGSTDNSLEICEEYSARYKPFRILNQENQGVSVARNKGIDNAQGEWIAFLDADDYLLNDGYAKVFLPFEDKEQVEIIHYFSTYDFLPVRSISNEVAYEGSVYDFIKYKDAGLPSFCWLYIYRKKFLDKHNLRFKKYVVGEDQLFISSVFLLNPYIVSSRANIYRYVIVPNSATTNRNKVYIRRAVVDYILAYRDIIELGKKTAALDSEVWRRCLKSINSKKYFAVSRIISAEYNREEFVEIRTLVKESGFFPIRTYSTSWKNKMQVKMMNTVMKSYIIYLIVGFFYKKWFPYYQKKVLQK